MYLKLEDKMREKTREKMNPKVRKQIILFLFVVLIITTAHYYYTKNIDLRVTRVIDGDTFVLSNGEKVRLICVNTPEKEEDGYGEATDFLNSLILGKKVKMERDVSNRDKYGRLLRYVYLEDLFVNKEIVSQGYGIIYPVEPDISRCSEFV
jgi:endonuclease YncB( thermonuclease family)